MNSPDFIQITKDEANSEHVDDLLRRQMSMRGESGVTRSTRKKWYFRSWLVLGLAGMLGAIVAWALLEPVFNDMVYVRGTITEVVPFEHVPASLIAGEREFPLAVTGTGAISINDEKIHLTSRAKVLAPDGSRPHLNVADLQVGQRVGVYVERLEAGTQAVNLAFFAELNPPDGDDTTMTIEQMSARSNAASLVLFGAVAGLAGLFIGAVDGTVCRLVRRALIAGGVGLVVGLAGGFLSGIIANIVYAPLTELALSTNGEAEGFTAFGFLIQMGGRGIAWALAGCAMGLGQGIALRSGRLVIYGLIGGLVGGLLGGLLFDPIDMLLLGTDKPSAHWSRLVGFATVGLSVGVMIGVVELLARNAWLRMTQGPLTGKEFLLFKDVMNIGSSPRSDIYLFNDAAVAADHAILRAVGDECELEARDTAHPVFVNTRPIRRIRLRHGDNVTIGRTMFVFQRRKA